MLRSKPPKPRKCRICPTVFTPSRSMQKVCGTACAVAWSQQQAKRSAEKEARAIRAQTRARLEEIKTIPELLKEAQSVFNKFIRLRDAGKLCICCGLPLAGNALTGGGYDCGHYRSVGSAGHLRFNEDNAHGQRKVCNRWGAGRAVDYRIGLIARIGIDRVEALENNNETHKWTREELISIRDQYRQKCRDIERAQRLREAA